MTPSLFLHTAITPALRLLPRSMDSVESRAQILAIDSTISGVNECIQHPLTPHHTHAIRGRARMAKSKPNTAPIHSRLPNGRPQFMKVCYLCGAESIVRKRQLLERPCLVCAIEARDKPKRNGLIVHSRTAHGVALYERPCPGCGDVALVGIRDVGHRCRVCACKAKSTHGLSNHPLYRIIKSAEARCRYPATKDYKWYGGRGISVCQEWTSHPEKFIEWALVNGWTHGLELDRRDNDGDYTPDNCRFVTHLVNTRNRRVTRKRNTSDS